ncbi:MAG TPA: hypothetical protein VEC16_04765 [Alphaproteobacteria bacterium]|nr:hypothetical protein [Alphaproteobacteria bacterium]
MKKGQAAIEFLITYGWAIMAAISVIGALAYFGLTNPSSSLPDKCLFSNAFECRDYYVNSTAIRVKLVNSLGESIYQPNTTINITSYLTDNTTINCSTTNAAILEPEGSIEIICRNMTGTPFTNGDKVKTRISVYYANRPGGYSQVSLGEVYATVQ